MDGFLQVLFVYWILQLWFIDQKIELFFFSFALNIEVGSRDNRLRNEKRKKEWKKTKSGIIGNTNQYTTDTQAPQVSKMEIRRWINSLQSIEESDWGDGKLYPGQRSEGTVPEAEGWGP